MCKSFFKDPIHSGISDGPHFQGGCRVIRLNRKPHTLRSVVNGAVAIKADGKRRYSRQRDRRTFSPSPTVVKCLEDVMPKPTPHSEASLPPLLLRHSLRSPPFLFPLSLPLALLILGLASRPLYDCHSMIVSQQDFAPPITYLAYVSDYEQEGRKERN